jgi:glycosyltransferase involved in cell wall biosynthesis
VGVLHRAGDERPGIRSRIARPRASEQSMKALYISRGFGDYVIELLNGMCGEVETHVAVARQDEWIVTHLDQRVQVFDAGSPRVRDWRNVFALSRLHRYIRALRPDVMHLQSGVIWELALPSVLRRIPAVLTVHDLTRHPTHNGRAGTPQRVLDYALRVCDGIVVHGPALQDAARQRCDRLGVSRNIRSIPHGTLSRYGQGRARASPRSKTVLLFGTLDKYKGVEYLIAAEKEIRRRVPDVRIVIAGKSAVPGYYEQLVEAGQSIEIRSSRQSDADVRALFESADVLVLPYIEASQSGVLQVGFAFGVPPVVTSVGALTDVVQHGRNGIVVPPHDSEQLAHAVCRLLTDEVLRDRIINQIVMDRETTFHWGNIANETRRFYETVIDARAAGLRRVVARR